jgi:hypothetical protein
VRTFVKERGHADRYRDLSVNYIDHHNPDLVLFDDAGEELQRIDLTRLKTTANIHKLLGMLEMVQLCHDDDPNCPTWKAQGECEANPSFMRTSCRLSCGVCKASDVLEDARCKNSSPDNECEYWSTMGECTKNPGFMSTACRRSCSLCGEPEEEEEVDDDLLDDDEFYHRYQDKDEV